MNDNLHISENGLNFIKNWEGCILHVYNDVVNVATVGVGHALTPAEKSSGMYNGGITLQQALDILAKDINRFEIAIKKYVTVELNQNQFDALCSLTFNVGTGVLVNSGLIKALNVSNYVQVPTEILKWCKAGGKVNQGLLNRRKSEAALFVKTADPIVVQQDPPTPEPISDPVTIPEVEIVASPEVTPATTNVWRAISNFFTQFLKK